jgi:hypothetical protein
MTMSFNIQYQTQRELSGQEIVCGKLTDRFNSCMTNNY